MDKKLNHILFSIIMPTYNRANMIGIAIESLLKQTYNHWELIIVDDGSVDDTRKVVGIYSARDNRIKYVFQMNQGESAARNVGLLEAKGDFISFLDDDDYYLENFLAVFEKNIKEGKTGLAVFMCDQAEESDHVIKMKQIDKKKFVKNSLSYLIRFGNNLQPFVFPANIFKEEFFDTRFVYGEDVHLLYRILLRLPLFYVQETLCVYKNHQNMTFNREFKDGLFLKTSFTRLDMFDDLFLKYKKAFFERAALSNLCFKFNRYCYFYASAALKKQKTADSLAILKRMKWDQPNFEMLYYYISIISRFLYYALKKKILVIS
ncbi:MAG TPA: hypothetical protein DCX89_03305, partial [Saprospirales bacterium]|nr:hypothetical protein [Saprospirales bacterium]